jgi:hypothetical protein
VYWECRGPSGVGPPVHVDGSGPRESEGELAHCHKGSVFGGGAHVTLDVFVLGHPVIYWGQCAWHIVGGGDPGRGRHACVRRGEWDEGRSGRGSQRPNKGLIVVNVGEGDWRGSSGGSSVHV